MPGARNRLGGHPESGERKPKKMWSKPVFWLIGVIVSAIGIAITNAIVPWLSAMFDVISGKWRASAGKRRTNVLSP